jgi:hypothetical protein
MGLRARATQASRGAHLWLPGYLATRLRRWNEPAPKRVWVTITDHFEPLFKRPTPAIAAERVARWSSAWPLIAGRHIDGRGRSPQYCFFYPAEEYRPELVEPLARMARQGIADVEVHLHHDNDTPDAFREAVTRFVASLDANHGLLRKVAGRLAFGFIHGNWALDNARPDGRWCGLNNEITLLRELGCYADFTMPAAPNPSQAGPVNWIFRVSDDPLQPRSHARGTIVQPGTPSVGDITLIPGPLAVFSGGDRWLPRLDTGEVAAHARTSEQRTRRWLRVAPRVGTDAFIKLFSHGAQERNADSLLTTDLDTLFESLRRVAREAGSELRYVTTWEMFLAVEALRQRADPEQALGWRP